ncbi:hypothetical protein FUA23_06255 [Neolewinella aurantiaca]|uniref:DUF3558 domain-containing protein n=1 Tax=Neolewinella aurantiaca TaxID=2602767 RepID=A0A5C7FIK2_9BACT|nr:hypothetical protein [Neolewinella aurantiaca]TXF90389.1 hypothetical protein FUA23_06255 [Neolewinella aurantiaca]
MKSLSLALLFFVSLSCGDKNAQTAAVAAPATAQPAIAVSVQEPIDPPCKTFSHDLVAETFGWAGSGEGQPNSMSDGRVQNCTFMSTDNSGLAHITISKSDERTIEMKYVERAFIRDLEREDDRISSIELPAELGDQTIYTTGQKGPHYLYVLRWRVGNLIDYNITLRTNKRQEKDAVLKQLKSLAAKLTA